MNPVDIRKMLDMLGMIYDVPLDTEWLTVENGYRQVTEMIKKYVINHPDITEESYRDFVMGVVLGYSMVKYQ